MHIPKFFEENDSLKSINTIRDYPFGTIITLQDGYPFPNHIPLLIERTDHDKIKLTGHMARQNPQWKHLQQNQNVTVVFHGPHTYITPSWYPAPENVPNWNYVTVYIQGKGKVIADFDGIHAILNRSVEEFEKFEARPWTFLLPQKIKENLIKGIIGFEIDVERIAGKFKLSQNRTPEDQQGVIQGLRGRSDENSKKILGLMAVQNRAN